MATEPSVSERSAPRRSYDTRVPTFATVITLAARSGERGGSRPPLGLSLLLPSYQSPALVGNVAERGPGTASSGHGGLHSRSLRELNGPARARLRKPSSQGASGSPRQRPPTQPRRSRPGPWEPPGPGGPCPAATHLPTACPPHLHLPLDGGGRSAQGNDSKPRTQELQVHLGRSLAPSEPAPQARTPGPSLPRGCLCDA